MSNQNPLLPNTSSSLLFISQHRTFVAMSSPSSPLTRYNQTNFTQLFLNKSNQDAGDVPNSTIYLALIAYVIIGFIGFFGNALVILVAYCSRAQQNSTHYCLVNLSVADLLLIIVCLPSAVVELFAKEVWYLGYFLCNRVIYNILYLNLTFLT